MTSRSLVTARWLRHATSASVDIAIETSDIGRKSRIGHSLINDRNANFVFPKNWLSTWENQFFIWLSNLCVAHCRMPLSAHSKKTWVRFIWRGTRQRTWLQTHHTGDKLLPNVLYSTRGTKCKSNSKLKNIKNDIEENTAIHRPSDDDESESESSEFGCALLLAVTEVTCFVFVLLTTVAGCTENTSWHVQSHRSIDS